MNKALIMAKAKSNLFKWIAEAMEATGNMTLADNTLTVSVKDGSITVDYQNDNEAWWYVLITLARFDSDEEAYEWLANGRRSSRSIKKSIMAWAEHGDGTWIVYPESPEFPNLVEGVDADLVQQVMDIANIIEAEDTSHHKLIDYVIPIYHKLNIQVFGDNLDKIVLVENDEIRTEYCVSGRVSHIDKIGMDARMDRVFGKKA